MRSFGRAPRSERDHGTRARSSWTRPQAGGTTTGATTSSSALLSAAVRKNISGQSHNDRLPHYIQLYVVNRWSPSSRYVAWREAYGNYPLYDLNTQTGIMYESTRHQSDTRRLRGVHFSSGVLINANGKACLSLAQMPSGMETAQIRVRGQLHPDDDLLFPPVLNGISR
jgi:hypothetical protein